jgi:transposase-like protein
MSGRESAAVLKALAEVLENGKSKLEAARLHDISPSTLFRALNRHRASEATPSQQRKSKYPPLPEPFHFHDGTPLTAENIERVHVSVEVSYRPSVENVTSNNAARFNETSNDRQQKVTPLLRFIREINEYPLELENFVASLEIPSGKRRTGVYLYQLAAAESPNPSLRLARAIVEQSKLFGSRLMVQPLTYEDLLIGKSKNDA